MGREGRWALGELERIYMCTATKWNGYVLVLILLMARCVPV